MRIIEKPTARIGQVVEGVSKCARLRQLMHENTGRGLIFADLKPVIEEDRAFRRGEPDRQSVG